MRNRFGIVVGTLPIVFAVAAMAADRTAKRAAPEAAMGGLTIQENVARHNNLRRVLEARRPDGVLNAPVTTELSPQNLADLAAPTNANGPAPLRIGVVKSVSGISVINGKGFAKGVTEEVEEGKFVWALSLRSKGAQAIRVNFKEFSLPEGVEMYFYSVDGHAHGPYVGQGRNNTGQFWTRSIAGDTGILQLRYSAADRPNISFVVSGVGHIHGRPPRKVEQNHDSWPCSDNAACVVDVNCVNTGPAGPAEDAVAKMEWISGQFINTCTGGLLADTDSGSQIPYFLTANHCFTNDISNLETFFNYTTSSCNGGCPDGLVTGGTPPPANTIGITVVATGSSADFTLATLDQAPPAGATYLGWNNSPIAFTNGANLYRVSNANFGPQVYSQHDVDTGSPTCTGWNRGPRIYSVDQTGATMGGSSGSPVVNSAGEVVGQLSGCCGFNCGDECDSANNWTVDGALAEYWDSVSEFLDPQGGCSTNAECDDGQFCTGTETCVGGVCQSSGDPCGGGTTCNEATDTCDAPVCDNNNSCGPGEDCNNCPNDCRSKVNGNPNSRYCCDGDLPDCGDTRCSESGFSCGGGGGGCTTDPECDDADPCNGAETCVGGSCQNGTPPPCQNGDGCCPSGCNSGNDNDCSSCGGNKAPCNVNGDCCSGNCRGGKCKGN